MLQVERGHTVLVHAAAGGVGSLLCQWANTLGATVIGTVSTKEKAIQAKDDGCHHVIIYKEEDFVTRVNEITSGQGVEVVYDSVGKDTFQVLAFKFILYRQVSPNSHELAEKQFHQNGEVCHVGFGFGSDTISYWKLKSILRRSQLAKSLTVN